MFHESSGDKHISTQISVSFAENKIIAFFVLIVNVTKKLDNIVNNIVIII